MIVCWTMRCGLAMSLMHCRTGAWVAMWPGNWCDVERLPVQNYEEGCAAESRDDFIHKLRISLKELHETLYWLRFIVRAKLLPDVRLQPLLNETDELCKIIGASITTANQNRSRSEQK